MNFLHNLSKLQLNLDPRSFNAMLAVKGSRPLLKHMINVSKVVVGRNTANWVRLTYVLMTRMYKILQKQGLPGLVKFQKACCVIIQQSIGGHRISDMTELGPRVSRSKSGLPRILPKSVRSSIMRGDETTIKWSLCMFSIYRVIQYSSVPKFSSITDARKGTLQGEARLLTFLPLFISLFIKERRRGLGALTAPHPFALFTSSPNADAARGEFSTSLPTVLRSFLALWNHPQIYRDILAFRAMLPYSSSFERVVKLGMEYLESVLGRIIVGTMYSTLIFKDPISSMRRITYLGKLGLKVEAAGKVRVFAMVDCFTQWALKPLHKWIFSVLRDHPDVDGTFDQLAPIIRIPFEKVPLYSYDLSSATDRLPISLQGSILSKVFTPEFGTLWKKILVGRSYMVRVKDKTLVLNYTVGQPMGALSSWGMLALTHHFIVQGAAWMAGKDRTSLFTNYCVLGDDILIWDKAVANSYLKVIKSLGVEVGLAKSVISKNGTSLEFAKKTIFKGVDVSPVPLKEYSAALSSPSAFMMFTKKYHCTIGVIKTLLGLGYKSSEHSLRLRVYYILDLFPSSPERLSILMNRFRYWKDEGKSSGWYDIMGTLLLISHDLSEKIRRASGMLRQFSASQAFEEKSSQIYHDALMGSSIKKDLRNLEDAGKVIRASFQSLRSFMLSMETYWLAFRGLPGSRYTAKEVSDMTPHVVNILTGITQADSLYSSVRVENLIHPTHTSSISSHQREINRLQSMWNLWSRFSERHVSSSFLLILFEAVFRSIRTFRTVLSTFAARSTMTGSARVASNLRHMRSLSWRSFILFWFIEALWSSVFAGIFGYLFLLCYLMCTTSGWEQNSSAFIGLLVTACNGPFELFSAWISQFSHWCNVYPSPMEGARSVWTSMGVYLLDIIAVLSINSVYQNWGDIIAVVSTLDYGLYGSYVEILVIPFGVLYKFVLVPGMDMIMIIPDYLWDRSPMGDAFVNNQWVECALSTYSNLIDFIKADYHYLTSGVDWRKQEFNFIEVPEMSPLATDDLNELEFDSDDGVSTDRPPHPLIEAIDTASEEWAAGSSSTKTTSPEFTVSDYKSYFKHADSSESGSSSSTERPAGITPGTPYSHIIPIPDSWYLRFNFLCWRLLPYVASGSAYFISRTIVTAVMPS
jgi:hypothetical protein